ncbi:MAG: hypothetical protein EA357_10680 [Micavibrio sp.]|nr:MAG: hypothetical protein EA357_10680 [Micavibrio sp.]
MKSQFNPFVIAYAHPFRTFVLLTILLFLFPDLMRGISFVTGLKGFAAGVLTVIFVIFVGFLMPMIKSMINYQVVVYEIFANRIEFRQSAFIREYVTLHFRNIKEVRVKSNWLQKKHGLGHIELGVVTRIGVRDGGTVLPNIPDAATVAEKIRALMKSYAEETVKAHTDASPVDTLPAEEIPPEDLPERKAVSLKKTKDTPQTEAKKEP